MKLKNTAYFFVLIFMLIAFFYSCGTSNKGRNCDCPKFGENASQKEDALNVTAP